jgi:hypothetical protein
MSSDLSAFLFILGLVAQIVAIICAISFYAYHRRARPDPKRRLPIVAYVSILLVSAVIGYLFALWVGIDLACVQYPSGNLCGLFGFLVSGPLGASLAVFLVSGLILFLPADVEPLPAATAPKWPSASKLWQGKYSLAASFWGFLALGSYLVMLITILLPFRPVLILGYGIVAGIGVWRSSNALIAARGGRSSLTHADLAKTGAAKIAVVLWLVWCTRNLVLITLHRWVST